MFDRSIILAALAGLALAIGYLFAGSAVSTALAAQPVALSDASYPPDVLRILKPGRSTDVLRQCPQGATFSDVSAYRWNGSPLRAQRWDAYLPGWSWRSTLKRDRGRVGFDGLTFYNGTRGTVLVAGWCG